MGRIPIEDDVFEREGIPRSCHGSVIVVMSLERGSWWVSALLATTFHLIVLLTLVFRMPLSYNFRNIKIHATRPRR